VHFTNINSRVQHERQGAERAAINAPIQGTSADIIKRAMVRMTPASLEAGLPEVRMLLTVHDELVFELPEAQVEPASEVIRARHGERRRTAGELMVPLAMSRSAPARAGALRIERSQPLPYRVGTVRWIAGCRRKVVSLVKSRRGAADDG
jgi:DNA polymerase-1